MGFCGETFLTAVTQETQIIPHLWIVVTEPDPVDDSCLIVSVTTLRYSKDQTVTLMPGDHPFIQHPSVVSYADMRRTTQAILLRAESEGTAIRQAPCSPHLLKLVQQGIAASTFTPKKFVRLYASLSARR